jgi:hypothetical protein
MTSTLYSRTPAWFILLFIATLSGPASSNSWPGYKTRDQNPVLQPYLIPMVANYSKQGWQISHSLFITNTYQKEESSDESLIIDVENTRYDIQTTYTSSLWLFSLNLSLIDNQGGQLDGAIDAWHDLFGFPEAGRDKAEKDRLNLNYLTGNTQVFDIDNSQHGIGDLQLAIGYPLTEGSIWLGIELPLQDDKELISNDSVDFALWYQTRFDQTDDFQTYASLGMAWPADSGLLEGYLTNQFAIAQWGIVWQYHPAYHFLFQADYHSPIIKDSDLEAFDHSLQGQFGLRFPQWPSGYQLDVFISEDIWPGHAPDITFSLQLTPVNW